MKISGSADDLAGFLIQNVLHNNCKVILNLMTAIPLKKQITDKNQEAKF